MSEIFKKYDEVISLGYNCFAKKYIEENINNTAYMYFDYVGSSAWGILEIFKNNFSDLDQIEKIKIYTNNDKYVNTNMKYYIRHLHDNLDDPSKRSKTMDSLIKRADRLKELLASKKKIIFIRIEEPMYNRIIYNEFKKYYVHSEEYYLKKISEWLKLNTQLDFKIIYINNIKNLNSKYDDHNNILYIKDNNIESYDWNDVATQIKMLFDKNQHLLNLYL